jgi:hypothetical protein
MRGCRRSKSDSLQKRRCDPMLRLDIIVRNPVADSAITWFGVGMLALLAAVIVGAWVVAARRLGSHDENDSNPALETLRRRKLVVLRPRKPRGPHAVVVTELEPTGESEPAASDQTPGLEQLAAVADNRPVEPVLMS